MADNNETLGALWERLNDPSRFATPESAVEAILFTVRTRGLDALKDEDNIARLRHCDQAARSQIDQRVEALFQKGLLR